MSSAIRFEVDALQWTLHFFCRFNPKKNTVARIPIGPCSSLFKQKMQTQKAIYYILLSHKTTDIGQRILLQIYVNLDSMNMKRLC